MVFIHPKRHQLRQECPEYGKIIRYNLFKCLNLRVTLKRSIIKYMCAVIACRAPVHGLGCDNLTFDMGVRQ